jgi:hypothetical protein
VRVGTKKKREKIVCARTTASTLHTLPIHQHIPARDPNACACARTDTAAMSLFFVCGFLTSFVLRLLHTDA